MSDEHSYEACVRVWDNGDSWYFECAHLFPLIDTVGTVCGRGGYGFASKADAETAVKTHHWVAHVSCGVAA